MRVGVCACVVAEVGPIRCGAVVLMKVRTKKKGKGPIDVQGRGVVVGAKQGVTAAMGQAVKVKTMAIDRRR